MNHIQQASVILYGLSTCVHCRKVHALLEESNIYYDAYWVDQEKGEERAALLRKVKTVNPRISFPTLVFESGEVIVGEEPEAIKKAIKTLPTQSRKQEKKGKKCSLIVKDMMEKIAPIQRKQGYIFNPYENIAEELVEQLLECKENFGYMCCPCRLASGNRDHDRDIICPCEYRRFDVEEYGVCFCGLYIAAEPSSSPKKRTPVPDRRPPEKVI